MSIVSNQWNFYHYNFGEQREFAALISFDESVVDPKNQESYLNCKRVIFRVTDNSQALNNGLLTKEADTEVMQYADEFLKMLESGKVDCKFVGRMMYYAMKEFVFQVNDSAAFNEVVQKWIPTVRNFEIELLESSGWDFYNTKLKPDPQFRRQITDRQLVSGLVEAGSDPTKPHLLEHTFIGNHTSLEKIKNEAKQQGFHEISLVNDQLVIGREQILNPDEISSVTGMLAWVADQNGVRYDGWGAKIVK